jgi:hypothetical protein
MLTAVYPCFDPSTLVLADRPGPADWDYWDAALGNACNKITFHVLIFGRRGIDQTRAARPAKLAKLGTMAAKRDAVAVTPTGGARSEKRLAHGRLPSYYHTAILYRKREETT